MDWILSFLTVFMNFLLSKKIKWAWILMIILSLLWIYYALSLNPPQYGLLPATGLNLCIGIISAISWFKEDKKKYLVGEEQQFTSSQGIYLKPVGSHNTDPFIYSRSDPTTKPPTERKINAEENN